MKYEFISIYNLARKIYQQYVDTVFDSPIDFTADQRIEIECGDDPSGWYGIEVINRFDTRIVCIGYYGGGFFESIEINRMKFSEFLDELVKLFNRTGILDRVVNKDSEICVDKTDSIECPCCGNEFIVTSIESDKFGWHTSCPHCSVSFDVDVKIN